MIRIINRDLLNSVKDAALNEIKNSKCRILICAGTWNLSTGNFINILSLYIQA